MNDSNIHDAPEIYSELVARCKEIGFTMPSDIYIGALLKTLITSKPKSNLLELGTGIGLSLAWMIEGMDGYSRLTTIDNDPKLSEIAMSYFGTDKRVDIVCADGTEWIKNYHGEKFDLIFADAWPGKYSELDETLALIKTGGFYVIDDMTAQPNWSEGHDEKAHKLINDLESRDDLNISKMNWSTGVIICTKKYAAHKSNYL
jgi:predicted O-methyltransferase YrrM